MLPSLLSQCLPEPSLVYRRSIKLPSQVSDSKKKRAAAKKAKAPGGTTASTKEVSSPNENEAPANGVHEVAKQLEDADITNERTCTSILTSHPQSRDIHLESFTLLFHGHELLVDTDLELNFGR